MSILSKGVPPPPPAVALANFFGEFYKDLILRRLLLSNLSKGVGPAPRTRFLPLAKLGRFGIRGGGCRALSEDCWVLDLGFWV